MQGNVTLDDECGQGRRGAQRRAGAVAKQRGLSA